MISTAKNNSIATFVRKRRKETGYTQVQFADFTGVGLRFLRELEQGKPNLMMNKVNEVLLIFGHTLVPSPIKLENN